MTIVVYRSNSFSLCYMITQVPDEQSVAFFGLYDHMEHPTMRVKYLRYVSFCPWQQLLILFIFISNLSLTVIALTTPSINT